MQFDLSVPELQVDGYQLRRLVLGDEKKVLRLSDTVLASLGDSRWYFPMREDEPAEWIANNGIVGYFRDEELVAFASIAPWTKRGEHCYAYILHHPIENTYDFHDVMVHPAHRGHKMHQRFLKLFSDTARAMGGKAIYATVDPENAASWYNFEKAGYTVVLTKPAYDGRERRYYQKIL